MNTVPLFIQVSNILKSRIETGEYVYGEPFPTEKDLSEEFKINRRTIRKAKNILESEGMIHSIRGKGTYICKPRFRFDDGSGFADSFTSLSIKYGFKPDSSVIVQEKVISGRKMSTIFNINENEYLYHILRIRRNDGHPVAIEDTYIPYDLIDDIEKYDFSIYSLYDIMMAKHITFSGVSDTIEAIYPTSDIAQALEINSSEGIYKAEFYVYGKNDKLIEYTQFYSSDACVNILT